MNILEDQKNVKNVFKFPISLDKWSLFPKHLQTLTTYQYSLFQIIEKNIQKSWVETNISNGKSTGLIFNFIGETFKHPSTPEVIPITLCLYPHKTFVQKFHKKIQAFQPFLEAIGCEYFFDDDSINKILEKPKRRIFIGTLQECIKQFREEKVSLREIDSIVVSDLDYLTSFGQSNNFSRIFKYFQSKQKDFMNSIRVLLITNDDSLDEMQKIKTELECQFTILRIKKEIKKSSNLTSIEASKKKGGKSSELMKAIFNQYFFIGSKLQEYSLLYTVLKFGLFAEGTLIVTDNINTSYLISAFLERCQLGVVKTYNPQHPTTLKAYVVSLFNAKQSSIIVTTKVFLDDYQKNKSKISNIRGIKNLIFVNSIIDYTLYGGYLELMQGESNYVTADANFDLNVLFLIETMPSKVTVENEFGDSEGTFESNFNNLLAEQERIYHKVLFEPIFVEEKDINLFTYRVDSVLQSLSTKQIKILRAIELKKIILKSRKMKEYFSTHSNERDLILSKLNKLSQAARKNEVSLPKEIPDYLIPSFIKKEGNYKIQIALQNSVNGKSMKGQEDGKKERRPEGKPFSELVDPNENPVTSDPKMLKTFSSHKLWKIRHHKIHKKEDKKMLQKGFYKS